MTICENCGKETTDELHMLYFWSGPMSCEECSDIALQEWIDDV